MNENSGMAEEPYFYRCFKNEVEENTIIVFDTNILLNVYLLNNNDLKYLGYYFDSIKKHIWTPHQVYEEFYNNRIKKIYWIRDMIDKLLHFNENINKDSDNFFKLYDEFPTEYGRILGDVVRNRLKGIGDYSSYLAEVLKDIRKNTGNLTYEKNDTYLELIKAKVFCNLGQNYVEEELKNIKEEGSIRFVNNIPPGYKDGSKGNGNEYGDYIIWRQMIDKSIKDKKNVIFVSNDKKNDWRKDGRCREELIKEFYELTGKQFGLFDLDELIQYTTNSCESIQQLIECIKDSLNENIRTNSPWNKSYPYYETVDRVLSHRKRDYRFSNGTDDLAYYELRHFREIIEYISDKIICGYMDMPRYSICMDILVRKGDLLEVVCIVYYKTNNGVYVGFDTKNGYIPIVNDVEGVEKKEGYLYELIKQVLKFAYDNGYIEKEDLDIYSKLKFLYTQEELSKL